MVLNTAQSWIMFLKKSDMFFPIWPSIGRYCGWNLDVVPLQSDEQGWYEVYQSLFLEFRKDAKWMKNPMILQFVVNEHSFSSYVDIQHGF